MRKSEVPRININLFDPNMNVNDTLKHKKITSNFMVSFQFGIRNKHVITKV